MSTESETDTIQRRLVARGFHDVHASLGLPVEVVGRFPPDGKWFYFYERGSLASLDVYPATWQRDAAQLSEWRRWLDTTSMPESSTSTPDAVVESRILHFLDLWRSGAPSLD